MPTPRPLNKDTKERLIMIADQYAKNHKENVLHYLVTKQITIDEMPLLNNEPQIKQWLIDKMEEFLHQPDPAEQQDRNQLLSIIPSSPDEVKYLDDSSLRKLKQQLEDYISKYKPNMPQGNIVSKAEDCLRHISHMEEENEWRKVDVLSYDSLIGYLRKHPDTSYFNELDDALWDCVRNERNDISMIRQFISDMPRSRYLSEANNIESEFSDWQRVKNSNSLEDVFKYWNRHYTGAFGGEADKRLNELKKIRLDEIKKGMGKKSYQDYENIINEGIITKKDMIDAGIITEKSIERLRNINQNDRVIDLSKPNYICPPKRTDVFLFGVPSTGKSCVIMGLLSSAIFNWNHVLYGAKYGGKLKTLCNEGTTPGQTKGDFASLITGEITDSKNGGIKHLVNIVDMAGEAFTKKIADNPDGKVKFADMGFGITDMLLNDNEKIFFLLIDPTSETIARRFENSDGSSSLITVYQEETLLRFLSLFEEDDEDNINKKVLKKVKAIHVITTKSDCLGEDEAERKKSASKKIDEKYGQLKRKLYGLCKEHDINLTTDYKPQLFTFSLGKFYYGGIFEYDPTDSNKLLERIAAMTTGKRHKKWYEKIKDWFNE